MNGLVKSYDNLAVEPLRLAARLDVVDQDHIHGGGGEGYHARLDLRAHKEGNRAFAGDVALDGPNADQVNQIEAGHVLDCAVGDQSDGMQPQGVREEGVKGRKDAAAHISFDSLSRCVQIIARRSVSGGS